MALAPGTPHPLPLFTFGALGRGRPSRSYSTTNRTFSSITLLAFHGMPSFYMPLGSLHSVRNAPGLVCQGSARSVPSGHTYPLPLFTFGALGICKLTGLLCSWVTVFVRQRILGCSRPPARRSCTDCRDAPMGSCINRPPSSRNAPPAHLQCGIRTRHHTA